jgi:YbbR domain-containing protein
VNVPYGVEVVHVAPATLPIEFENSAVRVVQVRPSVEGTPAPGYEVGSVTSQPATVEVVGPESSLRGLDEAMTEPISVANATRSLREVVNVGVADPNVRLRMPQTAEVTIQIISGYSTRVLDRVPVQIQNLDNGLRGRVLPASVRVEFRGTAQSINDLTTEAVDASVDLSGLGPGEHQVKVRVRAAQGLTIDRIEPELLRARIAKP